MSSGCPSWSTRRQGVRLFLRGVTIRAAAPVAVVAGTLLSLINQGTALFAGRLATGVLVKVAVNYATPFVVASLGFLAAGREDHG